MELGFSTNAFIHYNLAEAIDCIALCGYTGVEVLADKPHLFAHNIGGRVIDELKEKIRATGLKISNINANTASGYSYVSEPAFGPSLCNPDKRVRKVRIDYTKRCIDIAHLVGSPAISITSGCRSSGVSEDESLAFLSDSVLEIMNYAEKKLIRVGMEYEPGLLIESARDLIAFMGRIDHALFGANLDIGHSEVMGEDLAETIRMLSPSIFHIHIEDIQGKRHYHLIPGSGDLDFRRIFKLLSESKYDDFVTVELYTYSENPRAAAKESIDYLSRVLEESTCNT